jgi:hypothetical protein
LLRSLMDSNHDTFPILHHIIIREPEHTVSAGTKPFIPPAVVAETGIEIVALAVDLNDEFARVRNEVRNVMAHWALPAKSESGKAMHFQVTPQ